VRVAITRRVVNHEHSSDIDCPNTNVEVSTLVAPESAAGPPRRHGQCRGAEVGKEPPSGGDTTAPEIKVAGGKDGHSYPASLVVRLKSVATDAGSGVHRSARTPCS